MTRALSPNALRGADELTVIACAMATFLQAWRHIDTLKSPAAFGGWLRRLAINVWLQKVRAESPPSLNLDDLSDEIAQPATTVSERIDLDGALATLPPAVRLCITPAQGPSETRSRVAPTLRRVDLGQLAR